MIISDSQIEALAESAKLEFNDKDKAKYRKDLDKLINSIELIKDVDASEVEPMINIHNTNNVFRDDIVENGNYDNNQDSALQNAPNVKDGFIVVPKLIE